MCRWFRVLSVVLLCTRVSARMNFSSYFNFHEASSKVSRFTEFVKSKARDIKDSVLGDACPLVEDPVTSLQHVLSERIIAQDAAISAITDGFAAWDMDRRSQSSEHPMVLAFTGPTGVGKTESAYAIGDAIFKRRDETKAGRRMARGILMLRGEDYEDKSYVHEYKEDIRNILMSHFESCSGNAVVVFDEIQKVAPGVLDAINGVMDTGMITKVRNGAVQTVHAVHAVFILISDIGYNETVRAIDRYRAEHSTNLTMARRNLPREVLRSTVREALDKQWKRLRFGKMVEQVVPFLPMTSWDIANVVRQKLHELGRQQEGRLWRKFSFDDHVPIFLVLKIDYIKHRRSGHVYARFGARSVVTGGPISQVKAIISKTLNSNDVAVSLRDRHVRLEYLAPVSPYELSLLDRKQQTQTCNAPLGLKLCRISDTSADACEVLWTGDFSE